MKLTFYQNRFVLVLLLATIFPKNAIGGENRFHSPRARFCSAPCGHQHTTSGLKSYETKFPAMGTDVQIIVFSDDPKLVETTFRQAEELVEKLAAILTDYEPTSETRLLSTRAAIQPIHVSEPLWEVLLEADRWNQRSDGAFDCALGSLTSLWRKHRRANKIPSPETVQQARDDCGWQHVQIDPLQKSVSIDNPRIRLDFGAIGKGYIVDKIFELLKERGLDRCLVNISGNMRIGLPPPDRDSWQVAVSPIEGGGEPLRKIGLKQTSIATSGDLWQFIEIDGQRRSHHIDPSTGYGVPGPLAVTTIAPRAVDADALGTIGCIMEWGKFAKLIESLEGTEALRASRADGELSVVQTHGFPRDLVQ